MRFILQALLSTEPSCPSKKNIVFNGNFYDSCQFACDNHINTDNKGAKYKPGEIDMKIIPDNHHYQYYLNLRKD